MHAPIHLEPRPGRDIVRDTTRAIELVRTGKLLAATIDADDLPGPLRPYLGRTNGVMHVSFPLMTGLGYEGGRTHYSLGSDHVEDGDTHRDLVAPDAVNAHFTTAGSGVAYLAELGDLPHLASGELEGGFAAHEGIDLAEVELSADRMMFFLGGVATHQFDSGPDGRQSYMRHYR